MHTYCSSNAKALTRIPSFQKYILNINVCLNNKNNAFQKQMFFQIPDYKLLILSNYAFICSLKDLNQWKCMPRMFTVLPILHLDRLWKCILNRLMRGNFEMRIDFYHYFHLLFPSVPEFSYIIVLMEKTYDQPTIRIPAWNYHKSTRNGAHIFWYHILFYWIKIWDWGRETGFQSRVQDRRPRLWTGFNNYRIWLSKFNWKKSFYT